MTGNAAYMPIVLGLSELASGALGSIRKACSLQVNAAAACITVLAIGPSPGSLDDFGATALDGRMSVKPDVVANGLCRDVGVRPADERPLGAASKTDMDWKGNAIPVIAAMPKQAVAVRGIVWLNWATSVTASVQG